MKIFFACLISVVVATVANYFVFRHLLEKELTAELAGINEDLDNLNEFVGLASNNTMRVYHYVAGHKSFAPRNEPGALYCPECSLIWDMERRKVEVDSRTAELSARLDALGREGKQETDEYKSMVDEVKRLSKEAMLLQKHLLSRDELEKRVSAATNAPSTTVKVTDEKEVKQNETK